MFVYRFQYDNRNGIYNNANFRADLNYDSPDFHEEIDKILNLPWEVIDKHATREIHPTFKKFIRNELVFGFDTVEKFKTWFPEALLKDLLKSKSKYLKFCIFKTAKKNIVSDKTQCQFDTDKSNLIISCNMGCINF